MENLSKYTHIYYLNESLQRKYQENKVGNCFNIENKLGLCALEFMEPRISTNSVLTWKPVGYNS